MLENSLREGQLVPQSGAGGRIQKLALLVRRFGWRESLLTVLLWGLRQAIGYRSAIVFRRDLSGTKDLVVCESFQWGYAEAADITPALWRKADIDGTTEQPPRGTRFFIGALDGKQCYLSQVSNDGFTIPGRASVIFTDAAEAYVGNCVTLDEYRGMGVYPRGLSELGSRLKQEGRRWLYLYVERENLSSIRGVQKAGFRAIARSSAIRWRGKSKQWWKVFPLESTTELIRRWKIGKSQ